VRDLALHYRTSRGPVRAVDGVSFDLEAGQTLALVGESGCGKTSTASAITRNLPRNVETYQGEVFLDGDNVMEYDDETFRRTVRWRKISIVFQGAMNALNPTIRIGLQVAEPLLIHLELEREEALGQAEQALKSVGLQPYLLQRYPHELSGGMKQRVVIATALIMKPAMVILDEPTSALDIMTQANIINLLKQLQRDQGLTYMFITHDLSLASELADWVGIMYAGRIVEIGRAEQVYREPRHPYTQLLLSSVPKLRSDERPKSIRGIPPDLTNPPKGCRFHPRCPFVFEKCKEDPPLFGEMHRAACWLPSARGET
jgi:peptide/nickel transport system ATP-binding protein